MDSKPLKLSRTVFGTTVRIKRSAEEGTITGFALHQRQANNKQFFVEYCAADGRAVSDWFYEDQLEVID